MVMNPKNPKLQSEKSGLKRPLSFSRFFSHVFWGPQKKSSTSAVRGRSGQQMLLVGPLVCTGPPKNEKKPTGCTESWDEKIVAKLRNLNVGLVGGCLY